MFATVSRLIGKDFCVLDMDLGKQLWVALLERGAGLNQMSSRGPCQPQPFCNSVINTWINSLKLVTADVNGVCNLV